MEKEMKMEEEIIRQIREKRRQQVKVGDAVDTANVSLEYYNCANA